MGWIANLVAGRRVLPLVVALASVAAAANMVHPDQANAAHQENTSQEKYLGRWNYDQPDVRTGRNVIVINLPGPPLKVPQIGDVVFSRGPAGKIVGRTDQGCTWMFTVTPSSLELDPPSQFCHNPVRDLDYTITRWSVTVSGRHERETFAAISHQPQGDVDGVLENGSRTRADEGDRSNPAPFLGTWTYDEPDPGARVNIRETSYRQPDGEPTTVQSPERGAITFSRDFDSRITAHTQDNCTWSLLIRGNTAKLDPPVQTCTRAGSTVAMQYWTIASDGRRQASTMTGIDERGGVFTLAIGSLTRSRM